MNDSALQSDSDLSNNSVHRKISLFSDEYRNRRKQQMLRFFSATVFTLVCAKLTFRSIASRKYVPTMFQLNHVRPPFSAQGEAMQAFTLGTGLAIGGFSMLILGGCWIADISTGPEFSLRVNEAFGSSGLLVNKYTNMKLEHGEEEEITKLLDLLFHSEDKE